MKALAPFRRVRASRAQWKALFAAARARSDESLLAVLLPAKPKKPAAPGGLTDEVRTAMAPILAPAAEKAAYLIAHLEEMLGRPLNVRARGLAASVRDLEAALGADEVRRGAHSLVKRLAQARGGRDTPT